MNGKSAAVSQAVLRHTGTAPAVCAGASMVICLPSCQRQEISEPSSRTCMGGTQTSETASPLGIGDDAGDQEGDQAFDICLIGLHSGFRNLAYLVGVGN